MEKANTKLEILGAALDLFSTQGYEATSVSQIANAVGIRKASLYSHFESKYEILKALVKDVLEKYEQNSVFSRQNREKYAENFPVSSDAVAEMIEGQIKYILHDEKIRKARKMLVIEQFENRELAELQTKQNYTDVMEYFTDLIKYLISQGVLADFDAEIMAAQLCLPISVWINLCDREPEREEEVVGLVDRHIRQLFKLYQQKPY